MIRSSVIFVECCIFALAKHRKGLLTCYFCQSFNGIWLSNVWLYTDVRVIGDELLYSLEALYFGEARDTVNFQLKCYTDQWLLQYRENFKLSLYIFGEVAPGPSFTKLPRTLKWSHCSSTKNPLHHVGGIYIFLKKHCSHMLFFWGNETEITRRRLIFILSKDCQPSTICLPLQQFIDMIR